MIENIKRLIVSIPLICLAIIPPISFNIPTTVNSNLWFWLILLAGFSGCLFLYTKATVTLKLLVVYLFFNCFLSKTPYLSFTAYISFIVVAYYYLLCLSLKDFDFLKKIAQALFFLNIILIINQLFGGDKLLNFGRDIPVCFGTIGNPVWLASFLVCLTPFLLLSSPLNIIPLIILISICSSSGMILSFIAGSITYGLIKLRGKVSLWLVVIALILVGLIFAYQDGVFLKFKFSRGPIWQRTMQLTNKHPFVGWGIATYKVIVPAFTQDVSFGTPGPWEFEGTKGNWLAWRQAHNCWLQVLFESGYIGFIFLLLFVGNIVYRLIKLSRTKNVIIALSGVAMISTNMLIHYPTRMIQSVLIIVVFLAYCQKLIKEARNEARNNT